MMRIPILIFMILIISFSELWGQTPILNRRVKIESSEGTIGSILDEISRNGGFYFSYNQDIPIKKHVRLEYKRLTVQEFLDELFNGDIYCIEYGNKLLIKSKPVLPDHYTITGKVIESVSGDPVPGATVVIPGSDPLIGAVCNKEGFFLINVPREMDVIRFSSIGHETRIFNSMQNIPEEVSLEVTSQEISEVVIQHYSLPVLKESTVSISTITGPKLEQTFGASIEHALQGNAPGVFVVRNSGMPGSSFQVKIRGNHSLINSEPIYYLDGMPVQQTSINAISPNDIESIEILKDATSTAGFGASAGNGVVLLHSKKADIKKPAVTFNYHIGRQDVLNRLDLMNTDEFLEYFRLVRPEDKAYEDLDSALNSNTDWQGLVFHPAKIEDLHFSVSGGNERSSYYLGSGFFNQSSVVNDLKFRRYSIKFRSDHQVSEKWNLGQIFSLGHVTYEGLKEGCFLNDHNNSILAAYCMLPTLLPSTSLDITDTADIDNPGGKFIPTIPYLDAELKNNRRKNYMLFGNIFSNVDLSRHLSYVSKFGIQVYFQNNMNSSRNDPPHTPTLNPFVVENYYQVFDLGFHWQNILEYKQVFAEDHKIHSSLGFEYGQNENQWIPVQEISRNKSQDSINTLKPGIRASTAFNHNAIFGTLNYIYKSRYIINGTIRREVVEFDSLAGVKKQFSGIFPSFSAGWIFLNRSHTFSNNLLQYGKFRYAWGIAGNSPHLDYSFHSKTMRDFSYVYSFSSQGNYTNSYYQRQTNEKYYWERISAHNLGLELGMFRNRLFLSTELFYNHLHMGQISAYDNPLAITGSLYNRDFYGIISLPLSEIINKGIETEISFRKAGSILDWDLSFQLTHLRNRIIEVEPIGSIDYNSGQTDPISANLNGETAGSFYGYKIERLFTEDDCPNPGEVVTNQPYTIDEDGKIQYAQPEAHAGDYKFTDIYPDGIIDQKDKTIIGNPFPDLTFGFYSNLQYKQIDFTMLWQGSYGNEIYNATKLWLYNPNGTANWSTDILNSYRSPVYSEEGLLVKEGFTNTDLHRFDYDSENRNLRVSDFYVEDGSYFRLKNIQFGYSLNPALIKRMHMKKLRIFISVQNLLTITNYTGLDPEVGGWGIDCGSYPQPRAFSAGVNVEF